MKITLFLYPRGEKSIKIEIAYVPALDKQEVQGYWDVDKNYVALSWMLFKEFQQLEKQKDKLKFFNSLKKVSQTQIEGQ